MAHDSTLHVKVEPGVAKGLKTLARCRKQTVGELVRRAIGICYQTDLLGLNESQRQALEAYRGGYVSIGKLAEVMGLSHLDMRRWLNEHDVQQNSCFGQDDVVNA